MNAGQPYRFAALLKAEFVQRENRFRAEVLLHGQPVKVHVPNSGRMKELLVPGATVWIQPAAGENRKTAYTLMLVQQDDSCVCLNAHLANSLVEHWLQQKILPGFEQTVQIQREKTYGNSRFDFHLLRGGRECYAEVKSVNLLDGAVARFPDAPTERGSKHLRELMHCRAQGLDAAVLFVVMGNRAESFAPNTETDPQFAALLKQAMDAGVEVRVYTCLVTPEGVMYHKQIPIQEERAWKSMH